MTWFSLVRGKIAVGDRLALTAVNPLLIDALISKELVHLALASQAVLIARNLWKNVRPVDWSIHPVPMRPQPTFDHVILGSCLNLYGRNGLIADNYCRG